MVQNQNQKRKGSANNIRSGLQSQSPANQNVYKNLNQTNEILSGSRGVINPINGRNINPPVVRQGTETGGSGLKPTADQTSF